MRTIAILDSEQVRREETIRRLKSGASANLVSIVPLPAADGREQLRGLTVDLFIAHQTDFRLNPIQVLDLVQDFRPPIYIAHSRHTDHPTSNTIHGATTIVSIRSDRMLDTIDLFVADWLKRERPDVRILATVNRIGAAVALAWLCRAHLDAAREGDVSGTLLSVSTRLLTDWAASDPARSTVFDQLPSDGPVLDAVNKLFTAISRSATVESGVVEETLAVLVQHLYLGPAGGSR